ncbi:hypothetical protein ACEWPL_013275 [Roseovarius sp. S1116L3]|uniref:hypothetical protein n=1 Tax=Roseovarius roseus TaxID=3342636 RepID=UPI00372BDA2A
MTKKVDDQKRGGAVKKPEKPLGLTLQYGDDNVLRIEAKGDVERLFPSVTNRAVISELLGQIGSLGAHGRRIDEEASNFALGFVDNMKPRDTAEILLLTQMAVVHQATMMMARRLNHVDNIPQQDSAERALNKLGRTFAAQMETLKRYRSKGQQTVRVERVTVQDGGQAIVGNVERGGGGNNET